MPYFKPCGEELKKSFKGHFIAVDVSHRKVDLTLMS